MLLRLLALLHFGGLEFGVDRDHLSNSSGGLVLDIHRFELSMDLIVLLAVFELEILGLLSEGVLGGEVVGRVRHLALR